MEQFTMNEDIRAQLKYYTAKLRRLQAEKMPLEDTIAALMYRDENWRDMPEALEAEPPYIPGFGAETTLPALRMLAENVVDMVRYYNKLMNSLLDNPDAAAEEWLQEILTALPDDAQRETYRQLIGQAAETLQQALGNPVKKQHLLQAEEAGRIAGTLPGRHTAHPAAKTLAGLGTLMHGQVAAAAAPSGMLGGMLKVLGVISRVVAGCEEKGVAPQPLEAEIEQSEESKAIQAAILYLLTGDGCLPERYDDVSLRRVVPMVCMTQEIQGICTQGAQDLDSAGQMLSAALDAGIFSTIGLLMESGLRKSMIRKALQQPEQTMLAFQAACCIMPVITSEIMHMDLQKKEQLIRNMSAFCQSLNELAEPAAVEAEIPKSSRNIQQAGIRQVEQQKHS